MPHSHHHNPLLSSHKKQPHHLRTAPMANKVAISIVLSMLSLHGQVRADGYPNEKPTMQVSLDERPTPGQTTLPQTTPGGPSGEAVPAPPSLPSVASYNSLYAGLAPYLYAVNQYPVSTDYVSRYYGPIAVPTVLADGTIADTPAVVAARAAHLAALNQAKALWFGKFDDGSYDPLKYGDYAAQYYPGSLVNKQYLDALAAQGPLNKQYLDALAAQGPLNKQYLDALAAQGPLNKQYLDALAAQGPLNKQYIDLLAAQGPLNKPYFGPLATPMVLPSGYLADTPAIAAARATHLAALAKAHADAALWRSYYKKV